MGFAPLGDYRQVLSLFIPVEANIVNIFLQATYLPNILALKCIFQSGKSGENELCLFVCFSNTLSRNLGIHSKHVKL